MRVCLLFFFLLTRLPGQDAEANITLPPRQPVPEEIKIEAQAATQKVVDEVVRGNLAITIDLMNPAWKKKAALKHGGVKKYEALLRKAIADQQAQGIKIVAMAADPAGTAMEVDFGLEEIEGVKKGIYKQWMVFIPTRKIVTAFDNNVSPPKLVKMGMNGFMVALKPKIGGEWTFIDGSKLQPADLRRIFPFLPNDEKILNFPPRDGRVMEEKK